LLGLIGLALASWSIRPSLGKVSIIALVMLFGLSAVPFTIKLLRQDKALLTIILPALVVRAAALGAGLATGFIHFMARPVKTRPIFSLYNRIAKRLMDIVGALIGLVFSTPLMAALAVLIKLDSPGPIFFSQVRVGENGRPFRIIKLRSMVQNAEDLLPQLVDLEKLESPAFKIEGDPRVTHIGRFLRRTSLDELPQFWNVLVGNMSLVGPRPEEVALVQKYNDWHRKRLAVKPGMTGPMQVNGRGDLSLDERVRLELEYIDNYSIWSDLVFLIRTLPAVFFCRGAR
jgi:lipopolysaccharide/colanic/teichoic acid biosynthesis glycosyltransferase